MTTSDLLSMEFDLLSASDGVFTATIILQDSATPAQTRARYNLVIDGANTYRLDPVNDYFFRTPANTQGVINFRVHFAGIPAGSHVATIRVNNTATSPIDVAGVYLTPLFVDSTEQATFYDVTGSLPVGSGWSVLGTLTSPALADRHLHLSSYVRVANAGAVQLAYRVNGVVVDSITKHFKNVEDGFLYQYTVANASPGSVVKLEAQGPATVLTTEITAQTLKRYTVFEGYLGTATTVSNNNVYHAIFSSPLTSLNALSLSGPQCCIPNHYQVCWWGHGWAELSMPDSTEGALQFWLFGTNPAYSFESGNIGHSPDPQRSAYANHTSLVCGPGFYPPPDQYRMEVQLAGICPNPGPPITAHKGRVQAVVIPAPVLVQYPSPGYDTHTCTTSWAAGCAHVCEFNSALPTVVPAPPRNACN